MGSEPGVGWNIVKELAKHHDIWVLTRDDNRATIEAELAERPIPGLSFVYFDLPGVRWWKRGLYAVHFHYYLWQIKAYFVARQLHQKIHFDIAHHVTYVRYSSPSFLSLLPIPFIWGPVGGGESAPKAFWQAFDRRGKVYEFLRDLSRHIGERDPFTRMTARRSMVSWATTDDTAKRLIHMGAHHVEVLSQVGFFADEISAPDTVQQPDPTLIRFISVGRLLHWKGFHLGLEAFAQANLPPEAEYWLIGKGPEQERLRSLVGDLGLAHQVKFLDEMPREELMQKLGTCSALVHPSLHESGGFVCLEAMALGRPVICLELGGPAVQVTLETGFKVPAHTPKQAIADMAEAMTRLAADPALRMQMGQAAQRHVHNVYRWEAKALLLSQVYQKTVAMQQ